MTIGLERSIRLVLQFIVGMFLSPQRTQSYTEVFTEEKIMRLRRFLVKKHLCGERKTSVKTSV